MPAASPDVRTLELDIDAHSLNLATEALRGEADRRRRAAMTVSAELADARRAGNDVRTGALNVVDTLAEADALTQVAAQLADLWGDNETDEPAPRRRRSRAKAAGTPVVPPAEGGGEGEGDATVLDHTDDPDVAAARAELAAGGPPAEVAE